MSVIICPGVHSPELTQEFLRGIGKSLNLEQVCVFPAEQLPAYSAFHLLSFLRAQPLMRSPAQAVLIGFSAGVVGAISAAQILPSLGVAVKAVVAFDGWGVPLGGNFPIHRISHDRFTDWSSRLWGRPEWGRPEWSGQDSSFYAEPDVAHLDLWRSPQTAHGWAIEGHKSTPTTAAVFLQHLLIQYQETENTTENT